MSRHGSVQAAYIPGQVIPSPDIIKTAPLQPGITGSRTNYRLDDDVRVSRMNSTICEDDDDKSDDALDEMEVVKQESGIKRVYIEKFFGSPLAFRISLIKLGQIDDRKVNTEQIAFIKKIANIGLSVFSLDDVPLKVNAFEVSNVYGDLADIAE